MSRPLFSVPPLIFPYFEMTIIIENNNEANINLKDLIEKIDSIKPEQDLYSVLVDEQLLTVEV